MANLSFAECSFPAVFKTAQVLPLLKKPGLDKEQMSSYRPIYNLTTISKVIERTVGARQAAATPAFISELLTTAVSVPARALHRDGISARHEHGVHSRRRQEDHLRFDCHARNVAKACNSHTRALLVWRFGLVVTRWLRST